MHFVIRISLEVFKASGVRTRERLDGLVEHFAGIYGEASVKSLQDEAWTAFEAGN